MNLQTLDQTNGGNIAACLRWLETLATSQSVHWDPDQREAALCSLDAARRTLAADLLTLAHQPQRT